ncbi:uncharacterized protein ColSpa_01084 [Colletotrichum spaethianum]|uniref:Uncharacterized protein n=1 Tax=Colletotrichum spaethianum TaxID=700344 RepID=A0AA37L2S2_9PEZI|nr:uncharacterized protein ColSpa_01084 [Colletotrichum spaethianum]GKT40903.1 hypothetical protein ColSpa_01084 [Colletotrichum spaethianum]
MAQVSHGNSPLLVAQGSRPAESRTKFESGQLPHDALKENQTETEFYYHIRRYATSVMMTAAYGQRIPSYHSNDFHKVYQIMDDLNVAAQPLGFILRVV